MYFVVRCASCSCACIGSVIPVNECGGKIARSAGRTGGLGMRIEGVRSFAMCVFHGTLLVCTLALVTGLVTRFVLINMTEL